MPVTYTLTTEGVFPEDSLRAFKNGYDRSSRMTSYEKDKDEIEDFFLTQIENNTKYNSADMTQIKDSFSINITNNGIEFRTTMPNLVNKIEYGYDGFVGERFMEPSVREVGKMMSNKIIDNANTYYLKNTPIRRRVESAYNGILPIMSANKYGYMLK